jgi:hypothetical protein
MIWRNLARNAGRALARGTAVMDDYRLTPGPAPMPLHMDRQARWWARWLPWV